MSDDLYFENAYFVIGTSYAGKSTMVKELAKKHGGIACEENYHDNYPGELDKEEFPCLTYTRDLVDWHDFIRRTPQEYKDWIDGAKKECGILELRMLPDICSQGKPVFVDTNISIEKLIADSKESYYETLEESSRNWHEGSNDYAPFVRYMLGVIVAAYREFTGRAFLLKKGNFTKTARIREIIKNNIGTITKTQIKDQCPDISTVTVQRALAELLEQGEIIKIGGGRYTTYTWNLEKE